MRLYIKEREDYGNGTLDGLEIKRVEDPMAVPDVGDVVVANHEYLIVEARKFQFDTGAVMVYCERLEDKTETGQAVGEARNAENEGGIE